MSYSGGNTLSQSVQTLSRGVQSLLDELRRKSAKEMRHLLPEMESIRAFLKTLTMIKDTMSEERLRETIRNAAHSIGQIYQKVPEAIRKELSSVEIDPACGWPDFLFETFRFIGPSMRMSGNEMKVWIAIEAKDALFLSPATVVSFLKNNGVVHGIDERKISELFAESLFDREVCVASGEKAQPGKDGWIQYRIHVEDLSRVPKELEGGQVSFKDINLFAFVNEGDVIAEKNPPTPGTPGRTVTDRLIPPLPPTEAELYAFENTKISEEGNRLIAMVDGCITRQNGRIQLQPTLRVAGNVSFESGNIDSRVAVYVVKDVFSDFAVQSEKEILVQGMVEGAKLESKGNIIVKGGIHGKDRAVLEANGDISAKFISHATVSALNNVIVEKSIINSKIWAGRKVILSDSQAEIVGGEMQADAVVVAGVIGSDMGVKTAIRLGGRVEELAALILEAEQKISEQEDIVDKCVNIVDLLKQQMAQSSTPSAELEKALSRAREMMQKARYNIDELFHEIDGLRAQYDESLESPRSVRARKNIMPGTVVEIQGTVLSIKKPTGPATIVKQGEELVILPFKEIEE
ncbi:MAG: DUF342 domain-containing protein [Candidatus Omnitrophota bacterium]|jgi:uncharacterized protein (DUF342 family)|nr:MAG: DUF342 domain-containing protein [Candidatus Omnitrophota bacterium]